MESTQCGLVLGITGALSAAEAGTILVRLRYFLAVGVSVLGTEGSIDKPTEVTTAADIDATAMSSAVVTFVLSTSWRLPRDELRVKP